MLVFFLDRNEFLKGSGVSHLRILDDSDAAEEPKAAEQAWFTRKWMCFALHQMLTKWSWSLLDYL